MKNLLAALLMLTTSVSGFAYCEQDYEKQAKIFIKQEEKNQQIREVLVTSTGMLVSIAGMGLANVPMMTTGFLLVNANFVANGTDITNDVRAYYKRESIKNNSALSVLEAIKIAEIGHINENLIKELDKRGLNYSKLDNNGKLEVEKEIASIIKAANINDEICPIVDDKIKILTYRKFADFVAVKIGLKPLSLMRM